VKLNGKSSTLPLRETLGLTYPLRTDPPSFSVFPFRHEPGDMQPFAELKNAHVRPGTPAFKKAVERYEPLLVRQALLENTGRSWPGCSST